MHKYKIGDKVICVDGRKANSLHNYNSYEEIEGITKDHWVVESNIYTIRHIEVEDGLEWLGFVGIPHVVYSAEDFRPASLDYNFVEEVLKNIKPN